MMNDRRPIEVAATAVLLAGTLAAGATGQDGAGAPARPTDIPSTAPTPTLRGLPGHELGGPVVDGPGRYAEGWLEREVLLLGPRGEDGRSWRQSLEQAGVRLHGSLVSDFGYVFDGGVETGATWVRQLDVGVELDLAVLLRMPGLRAMLDGKSVNGDSISSDAGDVQGVSNLETGYAVDQIDEVWLEWAPPGTPWRLKAGKMDANAEFAGPRAGAEFLHSSSDYSPTLLGFPSFPDTAIGIVVEYAREDDAFRFGYYDGSAGAAGIMTGSRGPRAFLSGEPVGDRLFLAEWDRAWDDGAGRLVLGGSWHTGDFTRLDGNGVTSGKPTFHAILERRLWDRAAGDPASGGLDAFAQYGFADGAASLVEHHLGAGLLLTGTLPGRERDLAGLYASLAVLSDDGAARDDELAIEAFYGLQLTGWMQVKPSLQYVANPGGNPAIDDAIVGILRVEIAF